MSNNETVVKTVKAYQELHKFTDSKLAELLGIDRASWSRIRSLKRNPGAKFFRGIGKIPELRMSLYQYFTSDEKGEGDGHNSQDRPAG